MPHNVIYITAHLDKNTVWWGHLGWWPGQYICEAQNSTKKSTQNSTKKSKEEKRNKRWGHLGWWPGQYICEQPKKPTKCVFKKIGTWFMIFIVNPVWCKVAIFLLFPSMSSVWEEKMWYNSPSFKRWDPVGQNRKEELLMLHKLLSFWRRRQRVDVKLSGQKNQSTNTNTIKSAFI